MHELGDFVGVERGRALAALGIDLEDADHFVRLVAQALVRMRRRRHAPAERRRQLRRLRVGIRHLQRHRVQRDRLREQPVVGGQRDRRMEPDRALGDVGDVGAQRGVLIDVGKARPRALAHGHVGQQIGLDMQRVEWHALELPRRRHPHPLRQRMRPPRERGPLLHRPLGFDLHAGGEELQNLLDEVHPLLAYRLSRQSRVDS